MTGTVSADTIVALATPAGVSARAILRMSGSRAMEIANALLSPSPGTPGEGRGEGLRLSNVERWVLGVERSTLNVQRSTLKDEDPHPNPLPDYRARGPEARRVSVDLGDALSVPATLLSFAAPRSSTGEDVVEFHIPGSPWIVSRLLDRIFAAGARQAEPGEFTSRAFFHGKLDLASAEGVVATISASNRSSLEAARQLLAGELSRRLVPLMDRLANALALVEVGIDFSEEDVSFIARDQLVAAIAATRDELKLLRNTSRQFERLDHEPRIVLAGRPNAGKSSLLNALAGKPRAIVADVAGTTRDALNERIALKGGYITLVDVAGLDTEEAAPADADIARQMQLRAQSEIAQADRVVLVIASDDERPPIALSRPPDLVIRSKADLATSPPADAIAASVVTTDGLAAVRDQLDAIAFEDRQDEGSGTIALNARHRASIDDAVAALERAALAIDSGAEFVAAELRGAIDHLGRILGHISPDDVLGRIFSGFCIGK